MAASEWTRNTLSVVIGATLAGRLDRGNAQCKDDYIKQRTGVLLFIKYDAFLPTDNNVSTRLSTFSDFLGLGDKMQQNRGFQHTPFFFSSTRSLYQ